MQRGVFLSEGTLCHEVSRGACLSDLYDGNPMHDEFGPIAAAHGGYDLH
jgi:hypothetical protein